MERGNAPPLSRGSCTRIQCHDTLHTSVLPRCRRTASINHSTARSGTILRSDSLRDLSRKKSGFSREGQRNSPRTSIVSNRSLRSCASQKPVSGLSTDIPRWRRTGAKLGRLLHAIYWPARRVKGRTIRILPDIGKPRVRGRLLSRRFPLHLRPNHSVLHHVGIV